MEKIPELVQALIGDVSLFSGLMWLVALGLLIGVLVKGWPLIRNSVSITDAIVKLPAYMNDTSQKINSVHHEVNFNNGTSVKDAVTRLEMSNEEIIARLEELQAADRSIKEELQAADLRIKERVEDIEDTLTK